MREFSLPTQLRFKESDKIRGQKAECKERGDWSHQLEADRETDQHY